MWLVRIRPEKPQQGVAAMQPARPGETEIRQKCHALWLRQQRVELGPVGATKFEATERPELDHGHALSSSSATAPSLLEGTAISRSINGS
jgi:hypothetical protein